MSDIKPGFPKVSILIPVFNRKSYIRECIQSALNQSFTDFEVVVVDNSSTDGTWEVCQQFAANDQRVRIFRNDANIGPVRNWKRCAEEARGEFSKILFSDDCLEPNCLGVMVPLLDDPDVSLVYCAARIGESPDRSVVAFDSGDSSRLSPNQYLNSILRNEAPVSPGAVLIRSIDLLKNLHVQFETSTPRPFEKHGAGPDVMISLLTAINYKQVVRVSTPLVYFRVHGASFTVANSNNQVIKGYRSAIALYLMKTHGRDTWIDYVAHTWLQQIRLDGKWINPWLHLVEYEGEGSLQEVLTMLLHSIVYAGHKLFGKRHDFFNWKC